jgi:hypothetical protein
MPGGSGGGRAQVDLSRRFRMRGAT